MGNASALGFDGELGAVEVALTGCGEGSGAVSAASDDKPAGELMDIFSGASIEVSEGALSGLIMIGVTASGAAAVVS